MKQTFAFTSYYNILCPPQVALVFPNNDPVMFMVAFYGCLLAELVPVPIEVPLTRKVKANTISWECVDLIGLS